MEQLLLLTFTEQKNGKAMKTDRKERNKGTLDEMKAYLDAAANDLLQPRPEAVMQLLKKAAQ